jgi:hypothetical protein
MTMSYQVKWEVEELKHSIDTDTECEVAADDLAQYLNEGWEVLHITKLAFAGPPVAGYIDYTVTRYVTLRRKVGEVD